jgi:glycosyltransferase involved in cell wall biosynthesis
MTATETWHLITPEYPPERGGVADYTHQVACWLHRAGVIVHVWTPWPRLEQTEPIFENNGVNLHRIRGGMRQGNLRRLHADLDRVPGQRRLLVQWVPHGYGYRSLNLPFCLWLWKRAQLGDRVDLIVHEPFLSFREGSWRQDAAAAVHRLMACILLQASERVWVSTLIWAELLRPWALRRDLGFEWLPVPNNIPVCESREEISAARLRVAPHGQRVLGHFGTFAPAVCRILRGVLPGVLQTRKDLVVILLGPGSREFREQLISCGADDERIKATGALPARELSCHLSGCDLLFQPYPDGVNGRRGSTMAALAHGKAVVTNSGRATESVWEQRGAVSLGASDDLSDMQQRVEFLLDSDAERLRLGARALACYSELFEIRRVVQRLMEHPRKTGTEGTTQCAF